MDLLGDVPNVSPRHFPADQLYLFTRCFDSLDAEAAMAGQKTHRKPVGKQEEHHGKS